MSLTARELREEWDAAVTAFVGEAGRASSRARTAADAIAGIPIYYSLWTILDGIARDLDAAAAKLTSLAKELP